MWLSLLMIRVATALSCQDVQNMLEVGVPEPIVLATIQDAGGVEPETADCLREKGAPASVIAAAEAVGIAPAEATGPRSPPLPVLPPPPGLEADLLRHRRRAGPALTELARGAGVEDPLTQLWLGRALLDRGLTRAAERRFSLALRLQIARGLDAAGADPVLVHAWLGLERCAELSGDRHTLSELAGALEADGLPQPVSSGVAFFRALDAYDQGALPDARRQLAQIRRDTAFYRDGKLLEGVIYGQQAKLKSAIRALQEVVQTAPGTDRDGALRDSLSELALLNIAAIYYGIERFEEAAQLAAKIPADSPYAGWATLTRAWADFMRGARPPSVDSSIQAPWAPELTLIGAYVAFTVEDGAGVGAALAEVEDLRPLEEALREAVGQGEATPGRGAEIARIWLIPGASGPAPESLRRALAMDGRVQGATRALARLDEEDRLLRRQPWRWRGMDKAGLLAENARDRSELLERAGRAALPRMTEEAQQIRDLRWQAAIARYEQAAATGDPQTAALLRLMLAEEPDRPEIPELRFRLSELEPPGPDAHALYEQILADARDFESRPQAMVALARACLLSGERARGLALLEQVVAEAAWSEGAAEAHLILGDEAFARGEITAARAHYQAATSRSAGGAVDHQGYAAYRLAWCDWAEGAWGHAVLGMDHVTTFASPPLARRAGEDLARMRQDPRLQRP